jgi:hypothetical protein
MMKSIFATVALFATLSASPAFADGLQLNITYAPKAEKTIVKTYGERERETIRGILEKNLTRALGGQATRVDIVINNVVANRPTFKELGDRPSLSFQSYGIGGADISGKAFDANGNLVGEVSYDWYGDIHYAQTSWTWTDAERAFYQFSRQLARAIPG